MYRKPTFVNLIKHRMDRKKLSSDSIEDIYDGTLYKMHSSNGGILHNPFNISLLWNTDGVPVFKSSKFSIWPLFFVINELPYKLRMKMQNAMLGGVWFGSSKPNMQLFLKPFWSELKKMETIGILVPCKSFWDYKRNFGQSYSVSWYV